MARSPEESLRKLVAERIRYFREDVGMRQVDLEAQSGVAQPTLSQIQAAKRTPSLSSLARIAEALGVPPAALLLDPKKKRERRALQFLLGQAEAKPFDR